MNLWGWLPFGQLCWADRRLLGLGPNVNEPLVLATEHLRNLSCHP